MPAPNKGGGRPPKSGGGRRVRPQGSVTSDASKKHPKAKDSRREASKPSVPHRRRRGGVPTLKPRKGPRWQTYIHRTLRGVSRKYTMTGRSMLVVENFVDDMFHRLISEAINIITYHNKRTLQANEVQTAARLLLRGDLCKHAMSEGVKAVSKYNNTCMETEE